MTEHDLALPDFFLLGAAKSGTTSLWDCIQQHPALYRPGKKEPHVLNAPKDEFEHNLDTYTRLYESTDGKIVGDGTPSYFRDADIVIPRMKSLYGQEDPPKLILIFRDPVERAFSHYLHKRRSGVVPDTFEEALAWESEHPVRSRDEWKTFFEDGLYARRLAQWREHFPVEQFHVLLLDDLKEDARTAVRDVFRFLGVNPDPGVRIDTEKRSNQRKDIRSKWIRNLMRAPSRPLRRAVTTLLPRTARRKLRSALHEWNQSPFDEAPELRRETEERLRREFEGSIRKLENMIDRDLSHWRGTE